MLSRPGVDKYMFEIKVHGHKYARFDKVRKIINEDREDRLVEIYSNTRAAPLPMIVIGPSENLWTATSLLNFGVASQTPFMDALFSPYTKPCWFWEDGEMTANEMLEAAVKQKQDHVKKGSILLEKFWGLAENEAFMMGALDANKEVHLATDAPLPWKIEPDQLWTEKFGMSVLSHELITTVLSGYRRVKDAHPDLGIVYYSEKNSGHLDLGEIFEKKKEIADKGLEGVLKFLSKEEQPKSYHSIPGLHPSTPKGGTPTPSTSGTDGGPDTLE